MSIQEITVTSTIDGSAEPSLLFVPDRQDRVPLLVGLHSWSFARHNQVEAMLPYAQRLGWCLLLPEFRGPNLASNPRAEQACASVRAKQDILDAVRHVTDAFPDRIAMDQVFLLGGSGGGHMALAMAAYAPELWRLVSSWCPITDVAAWHTQNPNYVAGMERCCGGPPATAMAEYRCRSPVSYAAGIAKAHVHIYHGKWDESVPFTHSLQLYTSVLDADPDARVYLTIFDGGHELLYDTAFSSFERLLTGASASLISR